MPIFRDQHRDQLVAYWKYEVENNVDCLRAVETSVGEYTAQFGSDDFICDFKSAYLEDRVNRNI